ncbi:MAG TPA: hypothetical protein VL096_13715 [Pirellulaceae bacterium]|nr:hypothetical protein [Pirellulaceae bacterium]
MLIPKFSFRTLLLVMLANAGLCLLISLAIRGQSWAIACCAAIGGLVLVFGLYVVVFLLSAPIALLSTALQRMPEPASPFATGAPPPQIMPPREPE